MQFDVIGLTERGTFTWRAFSRQGRIFLRSTKEFDGIEAAQAEAQRVVNTLPDAGIIKGMEMFPENTSKIVGLGFSKVSPPFGGITCVVLFIDGPEAQYRWGIVDEGGNPLAVHCESFITEDFARASVGRAQESAVGATVSTPSEATRIS